MNNLYTGTSESADNRFQKFFQEEKYVYLKNYLYNYSLRKRAVERSLRNDKVEMVLEVGSGISPVMTKTNRIVFSDLSFEAIHFLRRSHGKGFYVVADAVNLPFKDNIFSHGICSEVIEHLRDDDTALIEMSRVVKTSGHFIITFPHRKAYFANDDRFVDHFRRYEYHEAAAKLKKAGFAVMGYQKVLGPLEKLTMCLVVFVYSLIRNRKTDGTSSRKADNRFSLIAEIFKWFNLFYMGFVWLDAKVIPQNLSTVLLIKAKKIKKVSR